jgi:hypothetical protein
MSKEEDRPRCQFMVAGPRWTLHQCRLPGRSTVGGKLFCLAHSPEGVALARQKREIKNLNPKEKR